MLNGFIHGKKNPIKNMATRGPEAALLTVILSCKTEPICSTTYTRPTERASKKLVTILNFYDL